MGTVTGLRRASTGRKVMRPPGRPLFLKITLPETVPLVPPQPARIGSNSNTPSRPANRPPLLSHLPCVMVMSPRCVAGRPCWGPAAPLQYFTYRQPFVPRGEQNDESRHPSEIRRSHRHL